MKVTLYFLAVVFAVPVTSQLTHPIISTPGDSGETCPSNQLRSTVEQNINTLLPNAVLRLACGEGDWQQVASLNMTDFSQQCPSPWLEYTDIRSCGRADNSSVGCESVVFNTNGRSYSKVCGRAIGYQYGSPDGFYRTVAPGLIFSDSPDDVYVDGLSVTHGSNPRQHIWTFAAGLIEARDDLVNRYDRSSVCPCAAPGNSIFGTPPPSYVGNNYFCETGNPNNVWNSTHYPDPLWDGQECVNSECCTFNSPPWFSVTLPNPTTDNIEARLCADQNSIYFFDEATTIELLELYVQ